MTSKFETKTKECSRCRGPLKYKCSRCDIVFKGIKPLNLHSKFCCSKAPSFECRNCDYKTHKKAHLAQHLQSSKHKLQPKTDGDLSEQNFELQDPQGFSDIEDRLNKRKRCGFCPSSLDRKTAFKCGKGLTPVCLRHTRKVCKMCFI